MASHAPGLAGHLGDETIAAMLEGGLSDEAAARARAHIATCDACRRMVSAAVDAQVPAATQPASHAIREELVPGTVIAGRYRIEHVLGEGGMGRVFVARQLGLERLVAVKILRPELARDHAATHRFGREARLVASLMSEQVVRVHDSGELPTGEPYLVMELLEGEDVATIVARGPVPLGQATAWILEACEALAEAHALGIVHRDIKPSNLFVTRQGRLKVLDFGLAKLASPAQLSMTAAGVLLGSPRYMAPEQITGARDVDARADVWSIGATLYHLVTGRPPFDEPTLEAIFARILGGHVPPLDGIPPAVAAVIARALARDPSQRFQSARELAAALEGAPAGPGRARWPFVVAGVAAVVAAISIGVAVTRPEPVAAPAEEHGVVIGSRGSGTTIIGSRKPGVTIIGPIVHEGAGSAAGTAPSVDPPPRGTPPPDRPAPPPPSSSGAGVLGNLDEARLRQRLARVGREIKEVTREDFPGCHHTRIQTQRTGGDAHAWGDVLLLACDSRDTAASEGARLRRGFRSAWIVDEGALVLMVSAPEPGGLMASERGSKALFDALLVP